MKKITLALCACAFALTGLLASCSSGSKDFINCNKTKSNYKYAVNGTIVSTYSSSYEDSSKKVSASTTTTTSKLDGGFVTVSWNEDENVESNYTSYTVTGNVKSSNSTTRLNTYDSKALTGTTSETSTGSTYLDFKIMDVDGTKYFLMKTNEITGYYPVTVYGYTITAGWYSNTILSMISNPSDLQYVTPYSTDQSYDWTSDANGQVESDYTWIDAVTVPDSTTYQPTYSLTDTKTFNMDDIAASEDDDAFDGSFGKEFSINIKIDSKDENLSYTKENTSKETNASSVEYKLTFVPVEDYDPADFADED